MKKRIGWLCAVLMMMIISSALAAETQTYKIEETIENATVDEGISNNAALEGFINRVFGIGVTPMRPGLNKAPLVTQGSKLTGQNAKVYAFLYQCISEVAAGSRSSTIFKMPVSDLLDQVSYTAAELNVPSIIVNGAISNDAVAAIYAKLEYNTPLIMHALMLDCPYELYWFDKSSTGGYSYGRPGVSARGDSSGESIFFNETATLYFDLKVAKEYSVSNEFNTTDFDTSVANSIITAAQNAADIVAVNSGKSDYDKLKAYKETICERVAYNNDAADGNTQTAYGNPWQLIWVFDDDLTTNVVCEGYSKAFKYLCDRSEFENSVSTVIATGQMNGGTGAGAHMWNIVTMANGLHYLVDVTNCDSGTVGAPDYLFLAGYVRRDGNTFSYAGTGNSTIHYTYDSDTIANFSPEELEISNKGYTPAAPCGDSLKWHIFDCTLVISGSGEMYDFDLNEKQVPWNNEIFTAVVVEDGVTSIGSNAFAECEEIVSVSLAGSVVRIGDFAFKNCSSLLEIELSEGIESIGNGAFFNSGLTSVLVPAGVATKTLYFYEPDANYSAPRLYSVNLPITVTDAECHAPFLGTSLANISPDFITPNKLTVIESEAFDSAAPTFVWLTDSVSTIGDRAFATCVNLHFIRIPSSCHNIGDGAFPADTVLLVDYGDDVYNYAIGNGYRFIIYVEGFND